MVSGVALLQPLDAALIEVGHPIRVVFLGKKPLDGERSMKQFEVFVAEGDALASEFVPDPSVM